MRSLVWFRRDLRIADNAALYNASENSSDGIIGLFIISPKQWLNHDDAGCKVKFWLENLRSLSLELAKYNIPLRLETCDWFSECPELVVKVAKKFQCSSIFYNKEYEFNESRRDDQTLKSCQSNGIDCYGFHDRIIVPPKEISTKDGRFYSVFTPYRKVWDTKALSYSKQYPKPAKQPKQSIDSSEIPSDIAGFDFLRFRSELWKPGEKEAHARLSKFAKKISSYNCARDIPSTNGTSLLSPYLVAGVVSARQCLATALDVNNGVIQSGGGATTWISELTWRDFYTHVLVGFPRVSKSLPFKMKTESIQWRNDEHDLNAWKTGNTGYPIVDAGMRQLNQTGWMHNRLRMVTAMFLSKHLMIDWRLGEKYFMKNLIDGDLAANNGGWQWSASTGTDAVPYFRIFNPFSQSKRFDVEGKFIKKFCPELTEVPAVALHDAAKLKNALTQWGSEYARYVVEHKFARERVLAAFKANAKG